MFRINDVNGNTLTVNEIYEEGFDLTASKFLSKSIKRPKRDIIGDYLMNAKNKNYGEIVIPTGISSLDDALGGGLKNGLYVIGANPGMGKTSLMLHILANLATNKKTSLFFSLDMSDIQTAIRLMANTSYRFSDLDNMTINDLSNSKLLVEDEKLKEKVLEVYNTYTTSIDKYINILSIHTDALGKIDNSVCYIESVEMAIKNTIKYYKDNPVVVIDFLQMLQNKPVSTYKDENDGDVFLRSFDKRIEMDKIIEQLKKLSYVYKVPVIVITSTNRSSYTKVNNYNESPEYDIGFSKESGNIEYMADVLIRLTAGDNSINFGGPDQECVNLNIAKSRFGQAHVSIPLNFIPEYAFFSEVTDD